VQESNCYPVNARVRALLETKFVFNVIASLPALQCSTVRPSRYSGPAQYWASRPFRKSPEVCELATHTTRLVHHDGCKTPGIETGSANQRAINFLF